MKQENDAIGRAILDFAQNAKAEDIIVSSDICEEDEIPVAYLFRTFDEMPKLEQLAIERCVGKILDIGAGAGSHSKALIDRGHEVYAIDISPGAVSYLKTKAIEARQLDFFELKDETYDTLLLLMNGIGIANRLNALEHFLRHAKNCLTETGRIICDSTDVTYLYEDDEGGLWMDLNSEYHGDFKFKMRYKDTETDWFEWLYVDFNSLKKIAKKVGLKVELLFEHDHQYLVELTHTK